ncbi:hypothetical protein [Kutzneria sp. NPDC052558]|uniref:hypothetical protein n=1 Tax=Kutzneria sp. NPDC052558 TaxID=3364121 RepID=UPI0037C7EF58
MRLPRRDHGSSERELRRRCRGLLRELDVQPPLDVHEFCARLAVVRGRPIKLVPYPLWADGPFGLWFKGRNADFIVYQEHTTKPHQRHIILHEVGHILADHPSDEGAGELSELLAGPAAELPEPPDSLRCRTAYDQREEREAETVATIILEWASILDAMRIPQSSDAAEGVDAALSDRLGWL